MGHDVSTWPGPTKPECPRSGREQRITGLIRLTMSIGEDDPDRTLQPAIDALRETHRVRGKRMS
jgi:hypothetical protein